MRIYFYTYSFLKDLFNESFIYIRHETYLIIKLFKIKWLRLLKCLEVLLQRVTKLLGQKWWMRNLPCFLFLSNPGTNLIWSKNNSTYQINDTNIKVNIYASQTSVKTVQNGSLIKMVWKFRILKCRGINISQQVDSLCGEKHLKLNIPQPWHKDMTYLQSS